MAHIAQVPHPQAGGRGGAGTRPPPSPPTVRSALPEPREHGTFGHAVLQRGRREARQVLALLGRRILPRLRQVFGCHARRSTGRALVNFRL